MTEEQRKRISEGHKGQKNVMKGKHHTEEAKRHMSEAHKGQVAWNKGLTKEKDSRIMAYGLAHKGKKLSEEERKRVSEATKQAMANPEIRMKISEAHKGKSSPMKGKKTGEASWMKGKHHTEEAKIKMREAVNKRWLNQEYREKMSLAQKERFAHNLSPRKGTHASQETLRKLSESHKGKPSARRGVKLSEEERKRVSEATKQAMANPEIREKFLKANMKRYLNPISLEKIKQQSRKTILGLYESGAFPKQENTKPERDVKAELIKRGYKEGIDFIHQYRFMNKFMCDFCFPQQRVIVEVYGDFWHVNPNKYPKGTQLHKHQLKGIGRDKSKEAYITKADNHAWTYIVLWESDIKKNVAKRVDKIEEVLTKKNND